MFEELDIELIKKMTVGIGDAAKLTGLPIRKIRYWEEKGIVASSGPDDNSNKKYDYYAIKKLILVKELIDEGYTLDTAARKVNERLQSTSTAYKEMEKLSDKEGK